MGDGSPCCRMAYWENAAVGIVPPVVLGWATTSILLGVALAVLSAYASTLSYAMRSYSSPRLAARIGEKRRHWIDWLDKSGDSVLLATAILRFLSVLALIIFVFSETLGADGARSYVGPSILSGLLCLFFAIGIPHALANHAAEAILAKNLNALRAIRFATYPVERVLIGIDFLVRRLLGLPDDDDETDTWAEQEILEAVSEGEMHGAVDDVQRGIIESAFELQDTTVGEIMTPRTDIIAIADDATLDEVRERVIEAGHSRIPVYHETLDHIIGVLYAKDLLGIDAAKPFRLRDMLRNAPYVPETKTIDQLLRELRQSKVHIALVLDEYGGTAGLVTIEDILEELVGEIDDEYDSEGREELSIREDGAAEVDGRMHVADVNEQLSLQLPEDGDYDTIGGFVFSTLGRIPTTGEQLRHANVVITVLDAEARRINRLRIQRDPEEAAKSA